MSEVPARVEKVLSPNDVGETGTHQAGILVPKARELLSFFPPLSSGEKNPRATLVCRDEVDSQWVFSFIYYNGRLFGGTRNEYRLTRMTAYLRARGLRSGDRLVFERSGSQYALSFERKKAAGLEGGVLRLGSGWVIISKGERQK